jgi:TonB family protein
VFSGQTPLRTLTFTLVMPRPPTSEPDPSKPDLSATGVLRAKADGARFETDFAQLAACFSAQSGGGLSPELSTDLALEIVLNEVVEQACLTTGATGAAIALERDGAMVCRASSGATAPALGSRLDAVSGLSGECIRTRRTQRSDDVQADPRVELETSQGLGVGSVIVMPLLREAELVGLFELFSSLPHAFAERDEITLEVLALRILNNLERAAAPLTTQNGPLPLPEIQEIVPEIPESTLPENVPEKVPEIVPEIAEGSSSPHGFDAVTWALRIAVLVCAVMLGLLLGRHLGARKAVGRRHPAAIPEAVGNPTVVGDTSAGIRTPTEASTARREKEVSSAQPSSSARIKAKPEPPPGSLLVFEDGKEIFRMPPVRNDSGQKDAAQKRAESSSAGVGTAMQRASSQGRERSGGPEEVAAIPSAAAEGSLIRRVEPQYPEGARQQKIQGSVVLDAHIGPDGAVQDVQVISGPPELAQASINAVKQWRFQPRQVSGRAVPMQTRITLNFRLPQ